MTRTPFDIASGGTEHNIQTAYFQALAMAALYGFTAALNPDAYLGPINAQKIADSFEGRQKGCEKNRLYRLAYAIPNGGKRDKREAANLKAEGVKPGVPDTHLPVPRGDYASLYIEFKRPGKKKNVSDEQIKTHEQLREVGNRVEVCDCWIDALIITRDYLNNV